MRTDMQGAEESIGVALTMRRRDPVIELLETVSDFIIDEATQEEVNLAYKEYADYEYRIFGMVPEEVPVSLGPNMLRRCIQTMKMIRDANRHVNRAKTRPEVIEFCDQKISESLTTAEACRVTDIQTSRAVNQT